MHGPYKYGGLNFPNLYLESGIQKLRLLLGHIRKQDKTGEILRVALGCAQQEVGISTPILEADFTRYGRTCSTSWIHHLWSFLSTVDGTIKYPSSWVPSPTFSNDINLMEYMERQKVDLHIIRIFNTCRLYKKVYYLGDLLDPSGTRLRPGALSLASR